MKTEGVITTIGLYANGTYEINGVRKEDLDGHIMYNVTNRPGRSLFVDGKCVHRGYHTPGVIAAYEETFSKDEYKAKQFSKEYH